MKFATPIMSSTVMVETSGLDLAMRDRQDRATQDLARIARCVEAESDDAVPESVPEIGPEEAVPDGGGVGEDAAQAVVKQIDLNQERRAPHQQGVEIARGIDEGIPRDPRQRNADGEQIANGTGEEEDLQRDPGAVEELGEEAEEEIQRHAAPLS